MTTEAEYNHKTPACSSPIIQRRRDGTWERFHPGYEQNGMVVTPSSTAPLIGAAVATQDYDEVESRRRADSHRRMFAHSIGGTLELPNEVG
jgi:hypothetical protein